MRLYFTIGILAALAMFVVVAISGITWTGILILIIAVIGLAVGALWETERTSYRFRKNLKRAAEA